MKGIQLIGYGDAVQNLELRDVPEPPPPGPGQVLVGVEYAPINFNDLMVPWGVFSWRPTPPATIGNEGAGVVLRIGSGVSSVAEGDRVVLPPLLSEIAAYQERLLVPAEELVVVPKDADPQQASMLGINAVSADLLLSEYVDLKPGDAVVFNSATSGLSAWLFALAKERGIKTVGLVRKAADVDTVKQRGCDIAIVDDEPLDQAAKKLEGLNIPLGLDVLGGPSAGRVAELVSPGAKLVIFGAVTLKPVEVRGGAIIAKGLTVVGYFQAHTSMKAKSDASRRKLAKYLGPKAPHQPVAEVFPPERVKDAVALAVQGKKVLLQFSGRV